MDAVMPLALEPLPLAPLPLEPMCDLDRTYTPCEFRVKQAVHGWEQRDARALRRAVFCVEQGVFVGDDLDAIDGLPPADTQTLVAMTCLAGQPDQVVGTVRIHRQAHAAGDFAQPWAADGSASGSADTADNTSADNALDTSPVWWGSRLAVHPSFRSFGRIGATLIRLAVCSAHAQGAAVFLAHVQSQNVPMFERLHWHSLRPELLHGRPHHLMRADLAAYPPCARPWDGFVTQARSGR
jgi:hypothetical protein